MINERFAVYTRQAGDICLALAKTQCKTVATRGHVAISW